MSASSCPVDSNAIAMTADLDTYLKVLMVAKPFSTAGSGVLVRSCDVPRGAIFAPVGMALSLQFTLLGERFIKIDGSR